MMTPETQSKPSKPENRITRAYIQNFSEETVVAYSKVAGKQAPLYDARCKVCNKDFTVMVYTALGQYRKYHRFNPPMTCPECYQVVKGLSAPNPPGNASILHKRIVPANVVPAELSPRELGLYRRKYEGKYIVLVFKSKVTFSDGDESQSPSSGDCIGVSPKTITILGKDEAAHNARTFLLLDVSRIEYGQQAPSEALATTSAPAPEATWKETTTPAGSEEPAAAPTAA